MTENEIQRAVFQNFEVRSAPGVFAFHPKNGGVHQRRHRWRGINKGMGVIPGVPDVIAIKAGQAYALELKADDGELTDSQEQTIPRMEAAGAICAVAMGLDAAIRQLESWGLLRGVAA